MSSFLGGRGVVSAVLIGTLAGLVTAACSSSGEAGTTATSTPPPCQSGAVQAVAMPDDSLGIDLGYVDACFLNQGPDEVARNLRFDVYRDEARSEVVAWFYLGCGIEWVVPVGQPRPASCGLTATSLSAPS